MFKIYLRKKDFFTTTTGIAWKILKKAYLAKIGFLICCLKNYEHVLRVWEAFKMKAMKDHRDFYL